MLRLLAIVATLAFCTPALADTWIQGEPFPDVVFVKVTRMAKETFSFDVTVSSKYDSPQRYADGFRITDPAGKVLGELKLSHDHATEQPFTRNLSGVKIAPSIKSVTVQARDQVGGYGGKTYEVKLPGR